MIRYDIESDELDARIAMCNSTWRTRAAAATDRFRQAGAYGEPKDKHWDARAYGPAPSPFWGQIKAVYMRLQKNKCAFCERKLTVRTKDHDVEHFRPKRGVKVWPDPHTPAAPRYPFPTGVAFADGYYLLAYHPFNYAASCEHCNRGLKRSYFPIEGTRLSGDDPIQLSAERPLLIYPIGHIDSDPERLLTFNGIIPKPAAADSATHDHHRARVTIDFFDLEHREELRRERAEVIERLSDALGNEHSQDRQKRRRAGSIIRRCTSDSSQHANCARCFVALYRQDPRRAERLGLLATRYLDSLLKSHGA